VLCVVLQKKPQLSGNTITCNDVPLVRETVSSSSTSSTLPPLVQDIDAIDDDDDSYVYDVYRTDDNQFDFQSLEHVLAIQALACVSHSFSSVLFLCYDVTKLCLVVLILVVCFFLLQTLSRLICSIERIEHIGREGRDVPPNGCLTREGRL